MIKINNIFTSPVGRENLNNLIAKELKISAESIASVTLYKRSVDARKKPDVKFCDTYLVEFKDKNTEDKVLKKSKSASPYTVTEYTFKKADFKPKNPPIIVGSGPAGLFAGLTMANAGLCPIIIEMGKEVDKRVKDVENFWQTGKLNPISNVQFGEGGAGTFSDGKLNTGTKDIRQRTVLETFCSFGADKDILINAKPHIGTDILRNVVKNIRKEIEKLGGKYLFETRFIKPIIKENRITAVLCENSNGEFTLNTENLILAIGNSSRDTAKNLWNSGVKITPKPFAVGVRIEHLQKEINSAQYGDCKLPLPPAEYKLATHLESGRGVYTFCMCPGGVVVNSASETETYVTNGMSYKSRDLENSNSALLVGVEEKDFLHLSENSPFGGYVFQENIEKSAYKLTGGRGVPCQTVGSFLNDDENLESTVSPTVKPNAVFTDISKIFPEFITRSLKSALPILDNKIKGFAHSSAILTAPETRSSSPIRIVRDENHSSNISGIYPAGEGAGYAGGITSSAVDGMKTAEKIIEKFQTI